jgi:hypothetical protein
MITDCNSAKNPGLKIITNSVVVFLCSMLHNLSAITDVDDCCVEGSMMVCVVCVV